MEDLIKIIELIGVRISDLDAISLNHIDNNGSIQSALYLAQSRALEALRWDLCAAMVRDRGPNLGRDTRAALVVDMGGEISATIIDVEDSDVVSERFKAEHSGLLLVEPDLIKWDISLINIPPLSPQSRAHRSGLLDMRFAFISWVDGSMKATICNTVADLETARVEFRHHHEWQIELNEARGTEHVILIPPRGARHGAGPSGPFPPGSGHPVEDHNERFGPKE